jgi:hypothetical protein
MKSRHIAILLSVALLSALPAAAGTLDWVSRFRAAHGLAPLAPEPALERAAAAYAAVLAASGRLAHRDGEGQGPLARYRAAGGSAARVGEILGAGPDLASVTAAWEASPAHAAAALDPRWTCVGAGSAPQREAPGPDGSDTASQARVWVVLFAEQRVEGFCVAAQPGGGYLVLGAFRESAAAEVVLLSGLAAVPPAAWDPARREFRFFLPDGTGGRYHRLGYRTAAGDFVLTSAFYPEKAVESTAAPPFAGAGG